MFGHRALRRTVFVAVLSGLVSAAYAGPPDYGPERRAMVDRLRSRHIGNRHVLSAMAKVPRHLFVDAAQRARAYRDEEIPLGSGHVMCSPYVLALMVQALDPKPGSRILEVGTGSGYLAAVLAEITPQVYSIDMRTELAGAAQARLRACGYGGVHCRVGRGCQGWAEHAPYDGIVVTCAAERVPESLIAQLGEGGRLVIPIGHGPEQTLNCMRKSVGRLRAEAVMPLRVSPMQCQPRR